MSTALITGATSGLGEAFARRVAAEHGDLVLVARDEERLSALATELSELHSVEVDVLAADLSTVDGVAAVEAKIRSIPVDLLINNAGAGMAEGFLEAPIDDIEARTRLHVLAVLRLSRAALDSMVPRGRGDVINVSSTASMIPGRSPVYGADKAWVTSFSEAVAPRVRSSGVRVMALCPGFIRTEFHLRAGIRRVGPGFVWLDPDAVALEGLHALRRGVVVHIVDRRYRVLIAALRLIPRPLVRTLVARG